MIDRLKAQKSISLKQAACLSAAAALMIYVALITTGAKRFVVWNQITDAYYSELKNKSKHDLCITILEQQRRSGSSLTFPHFDPMDHHKACLNFQYRPEPEPTETARSLSDFSHMVRASLMYPIVYLHLITGTNIHTLFSALCLLIILGSSALLAHAIADKKHVVSATCILLILLLFMSIPMNGRMIFAFASIALLVWSVYQHKLILHSSQRHFSAYISALFLSLLFSNVSSNLSFLIFVLLIFEILKSGLLKQMSILRKLAILTLVAIQSFWVASGLAKNIFFYAQRKTGLITGILSHGVGHDGSWTSSIIVGFIAISILVGFVFILMRAKYIDPLWGGLIIFTLGSALGPAALSGTFVFTFLIILRTFLGPREKIVTQHGRHRSL